MLFVAEERKKLLTACGVDQRTIKKLEALGIKGFTDLRRRKPKRLAQQFTQYANNIVFAHCSLIRAALQSAIKTSRRHGLLMAIF